MLKLYYGEYFNILLLPKSNIIYPILFFSAGIGFLSLSIQQYIYGISITILSIITFCFWEKKETRIYNLLKKCSENLRLEEKYYSDVFYREFFSNKKLQIEEQYEDIVLKEFTEKYFTEMDKKR